MLGKLTLKQGMPLHTHQRGKHYSKRDPVTTGTQGPADPRAAPGCAWHPRSGGILVAPCKAGAQGFPPSRPTGLAPPSSVTFFLHQRRMCGERHNHKVNVGAADGNPEDSGQGNTADPLS